MADDWFTRYPGLEFTRHPEGVLLITIDRPAAMNATDAALHRALSRIW
ncbi:MAG TPA: enoyl-CoA hydratase, partial [Gammaproteobacteria bacterium]|nr:enoyl-CoA hydratase [Gammaproteobacteria bacterium]